MRLYSGTPLRWAPANCHASQHACAARRLPALLRAQSFDLHSCLTGIASSLEGRAEASVPLACATQAPAEPHIALLGRSSACRRPHGAVGTRRPLQPSSVPRSSQHSRAAPWKSSARAPAASAGSPRAACSWRAQARRRRLPARRRCSALRAAGAAAPSSRPWHRVSGETYEAGASDLAGPYRQVALNSVPLAAARIASRTKPQWPAGGGWYMPLHGHGAWAAHCRRGAQRPEVRLTTAAPLHLFAGSAADATPWCPRSPALILHLVGGTMTSCMCMLLTASQWHHMTGRSERAAMLAQCVVKLAVTAVVLWKPAAFWAHR